MADKTTTWETVSKFAEAAEGSLFLQDMLAWCRQYQKIAWQPMSTAPPASVPERSEDVLLLVQYGPTKHAETGCRADWSSTGWVCTNSQAGGMVECEPLGWWPIPEIED